MTHHRYAVVLSVALGGATALGALRSANACGGFFCDRPAPNAGPPIAQAGENVLFLLDRDPQTGRGLVEAHVQIVYSGAADQFSWVVPVTSLPTVEVGSDVLFQIVEPKTRPAFTVQMTTEGTCKDFASGSSFGCGGTSASVAGSVGKEATPRGDAHSVDVAFHGNVGPYETAVLRSDDAGALEAWLTANQYFVSPDASRIIQEYVATQSYFVALRLQAGRDVSEIQPVVLKLAAEEGCLPLKLTAVATTPNLRINVWVLGTARAVPLNYTEVEINQTKLDWFGFGANYDQIVSDAANEAGGNAFTTEYAQPTAAAVGWFTVPTGAVGLLAAAGNPASFWNTLQQLGLPFSGRVLEVLRQRIPLPASLQAQGITEAQFYASLPNYWFSNMAAFSPFDAAAAAAAIDAQVLQPMTALRPLFVNHAYLTRLATFISAEEMTVDPLFVTNPNLPTVSNQHTAIARVQCGDREFDSCRAPVKLDIEDGHTLAMVAKAGACGSYDRTNLDTTMPAAGRGWRRDQVGQGDLVLDNGTQIADELQKRDAVIFGERGGCGGCALVARSARSAHLPLLGVGVFLGWLLLVGRRRRRGR